MNKYECALLFIHNCKINWCFAQNYPLNGVYVNEYKLEKGIISQNCWKCTEKN